MHIVPTVISLVQFHIKYQFFAALLRIPTVLLKRFTYLAKTFAYFCNSMDAWEILLCVWRIYNDSFKLRNCANGHWYSLSMWCENASLRSPNAVFLHHSVCCSNCLWAYSHRAAVGEACYDSEGGSWILQGGLKVDEGFSPPCNLLRLFYTPSCSANIVNWNFPFSKFKQRCLHFSFPIQHRRASPLIINTKQTTLVSEGLTKVKTR